MDPNSFPPKPSNAERRDSQFERTVAEHLGPADRAPDSALSLADVRQRIGAEDKTPMAAKRAHVRAPRQLASQGWLSRPAFKWAAGLTAAACVMFGARSLATRTTPDTAAPRSAETTLYRTALGEVQRLTLPDGSRITIAPGSILRLTRRKNGVRNVALSGSAHFDVINAATSPFIVQAGAVSSLVLGTSFDVRHYADDLETRVAVITGKVSVLGDGANERRRVSAVVSSNTVALATDSSVTTTSMTDPAQHGMWVDGSLVFRQAKASDVFRTLEQWYGVRVATTDTVIASQHLSMTLTSQMTTVDIVRTLGTLLRVSAVDDGVRNGIQHITLRQPARTIAPVRRGFGDTYSTQTEKGR